MSCAEELPKAYAAERSLLHRHGSIGKTEARRTLQKSFRHWFDAIVKT